MALIPISSSTKRRPGLTPIGGQEETNPYTRKSLFTKATDWMDRSSQGVKQIIKLHQESNLKAIEGIPESDTIARMNAIVENAPSIAEKTKAFMSGLSGEEQISANELYKNIGIEGVPLLGFLTDVASDPLMYGGYAAITKGIGKVVTKAAPYVVKAGKGTAKILKPIVKAAEKAPVIGKPTTYLTERMRALGTGVKTAAETLNHWFVDKSRIPELNKLISKHLLKRSYIEHEGIKYGITIGEETKRIAKLTKRPIGEIEELLVGLIEQPRLAATRGLNKDLIKLSSELRGYFKNVLTAELKAGVPITQLAKNSRNIQYFPRIASHELQSYLKEAGKRFTGGNAKKWNTMMSSAKKRTTGEWTLAEVNKFMAERGYKGLGGKSIEQFFLKSPAPAVAIRTAKSAKAVTSANFLDDVGKLFGKKTPPANYWQKLPDSITKYNKQLKGLYFDPEVVAEAARVTEKYFDPAAAKGIVQQFDKLQNLWKRWTLAPFPKYHLRNMVGNIWNNHLAGVNDPKWYLRAQALQTYRRTIGNTVTKPGMTPWKRGNAALNRKLQASSLKQLKGAGITQQMADDIIKNGEELGVLAHGWYAADVPTSIEQSLRPAGFIKNAMAVGTTVENNARLAHFLKKIDVGDDAFTAAQSVKKFLFDYQDLTNFEKQVMKRLFPFYTWTRKNIPLQLEQAWKQPQKFRSLITALNGRSEQKLEQLKRVRPDLAGRLPLQIGQTGDTITYIPLEGLIPAGDLAKLFPKDQMGAPWGGLTDTVVEMLSPLIKVPFELMINKSFFRGADIDKYDKQTIDVLGMDLPAPIAYAAITVFPFARLVNEMNKMVRKDVAGEALSGAEQALSQTLTSVYKLNLQDLRTRAIRSVEATMKELETGIMWANRYGRKDEEKRVRQTLLQAVQLLQKVAK